MKGGLLLNVVVGEGTAIFELLAGENEALLIRGNALLVLDLRLHVVDRIGRLDLQSDGLARKGLDEDLHTTTETEDKVKGALLLNVVDGERAPILELLTSKNQTLLVGRNTVMFDVISLVLLACNLCVKAHPSLS